MDNQRRRLALFLLTLVGIILVYTSTYMFVMSQFEGVQRSFWSSLNVVVESMTSAGYGEDSSIWSHPVTIMFVILVQFTGIIAVFAALPLFIVPLFEARLSRSPPTSVKELSEHVVVCGYTPHGATLIDELEQRDVDYIIVENDEDLATDLHVDGRSVVHGNPEQTDVLETAHAPSARAIVADGTDEENASIILSARECADGVPIVSLVERPENEQYHRYAGADRVISPEHILGRSLADKVTRRVTAELDRDSPQSAMPTGKDFEIVELSVQRNSRVCNRTLADSRIREQTGANLIGIWDRGEFTAPPSPDIVLDEGTVLLAAGTESQLAKLTAMTRSTIRHHRTGEVVIIGAGEVGSTVADVLASRDIDTTMVDVTDKPGVDVVGDARDEWTLQSAGIESARTAIVTLPDDTTSVFTLLVIRELNPEVEVVVRAATGESIPKMYRAGADYVLALTTVSGRMLASIVLDEDVISLDTQIGLVRTPLPALVGQSLAEADIRAKTGVTIVAVERDERVVTDIHPDFEIREGDEAIVAGTDDDINEFQAWACPTSAETAD
ncbi:potassium channel family protein [Haloarchaeobius sp. TZWWS8]|uniref:potassium channel family protein n=1 Tax=Haloarchaeobius sp. TZWWS8 TaxID=3446121 RepID=UPI003EBA4099